MKKELEQVFKILKSSNNKDAFELFYNNYNKLVYKVSFTILKNKDDSEDVVQSVFSKIYSLSKDKLPTEHILSWIYLVTKNECISLLRKKKDNINIDSIYDIADTDNEINNIIDRVEFNKFISKLNDTEKEIVSLKILSDISFEEIAKLLNKPTGTIKWKYYKSIHTLRLLLSNLGMFIITFVIGIKTTITTKNGIQDKHSNSMENKTSEDSENASNQETSEIMQNNSTHNANIQDRTEEKNITEQENNTSEEIQIPLKEPSTNINYYGIGILAVSSIFLLFTIILLINYIKYQLKRREEASK